MLQQAKERSWKMAEKLVGIDSTYLREGGIFLHCRLQITDLLVLLQKPTTGEKSRGTVTP